MTRAKKSLGVKQAIDWIFWRGIVEFFALWRAAC
jgi:hypothetical protein